MLEKVMSPCRHLFSETNTSRPRTLSMRRSVYNSPIGRVFCKVQPPTTKTLMMSLTTFCLSLCLSLVAAAICSTDSPFSADVVGRRHNQFLTCFPTRYPDQSSVEVNATHLIYFPVHTSYNFGQFCAEAYVFRTDRWAPKLTHYPYLDNLSDNGHRICNREQELKKVEAWPHGPTRDQYADGLNATIFGLMVLRDTDCKQNGYGLNVTQYQHPWIEAPISYLRSVAYNYGMCRNT